MNITVETASYDNPQHATAILELLDSYSRDPMGQNEPLSSFTREHLIAQLKKTPGAFSLIAFDGAHAVGLANCFTGLSTFKAKPLVNIHDLAVNSEYRGRGIGKLLLEAVEKKSLQMGCCKITLEVRADNPAKKLYLRNGYKAGDPEMLFWSKEMPRSREEL